MTPIRRPLVLLALCLLLATAASAQVGDAGGGEPIGIADLENLRTAGDVDLSADGRRAVYVVTSIGEGDDGEPRYFRHLWLAELGGPDSEPVPPRQLTHGDRNDGGPVFSPDGSSIAFVRRHDDPEAGGPQIWVLPLAGGEAWRLTDAEHGAAAPVWSPDGTRILYTSGIPSWAIEGEPPWPDERPGRSRGDEPNWRLRERERDRAAERQGEDGEEAEAGEPEPEPDPDGTVEALRAWLAKNAAEDDPRVLTRLDLQDEHELAGEVEIPHLFTIDARPGALEREPLRLTDGFQAFAGGDWTPDGRRIVTTSVPFPEHPDRVRDGDLWIVNADGSGAAPLLDWEGWTVHDPDVSPDGTTVAFLAEESADVYYALSHLAAIPLPPAGAATGAAPEPRFLAPDLDSDVDDLRWTDDGSAIYVTTRLRGTFPIVRVSLGGGAAEPVVAGPGSGRGVRSYDLAAGRLVYAATEVENPNELYAAAADGSGERRLSDLNTGWLADKRIVHPTERWIERPDGTRVQSWVMEPAFREAGETYPLVLAIHGGPSAMWGPGEFSMWHEFQLLAARGYGIVYANPRGSGGYGYDFQKANYQDWGAGPAGDLLAALDAAAEQEWVDPEKRFVVGGSYAGYMTAWIVGHDQRFDAAVAQRGVYDLSFFFGEGNAWRLVLYHFGGYPWEPEARAILDRESPLTYVEDIRTPLLIIHSDRDRRTGVNQSETLYKSLKVLERPVEYVRYPEEGHDLSRTGDPARRMDRLGRIVEFFSRYR